MAQGHADRPGQGGDVDDLVGLDNSGRVGDGVRQGQPALRVGVDHLDELAGKAADDVPLW